MKAFIFKIGAFLLGLFAFWQWGKASAEKKTAERISKEIIKDNERIKDIWSEPPSDDPFNQLRRKRK